VGCSRLGVVPDPRRPCYLVAVDTTTTIRLRPRPYLPILGAVVGAALGFAYYWYYGCDSG
jgi:hypothetical protein